MGDGGLVTVAYFQQISFPIPCFLGTVVMGKKRMGGGADSRIAFKGAAHKGLLMLMLKLPSLRGQLQILAASSKSLENYCDAYGEACAMLERLEKGSEPDTRGILAEYRTICSEIETEVIQFCLTHK
jgi:hypothetical protein